MKKVLIVDDSLGLRELLGLSLGDFGFKVIICESGGDAVPHIGEVDALITDFNMPGMNGVELTRIAKLQKPNLPVLIMTAGKLDNIPKDHLADKVIEKPIQDKELKSWLETI